MDWNTGDWGDDSKQKASGSESASMDDLLNKRDEALKTQANAPKKKSHSSANQEGSSQTALPKRMTHPSLGFLEENDSDVYFKRKYFPSKLGGRPVWLNPEDIPLEEDTCCKVCQSPLNFLVQVYAPLAHNPDAFHRTIFVFVCRNAECLGKEGSIRAFRSQLPRKNKYYAFKPPGEEEDDDNSSEEEFEGDFKPAIVCRLCGARGSKRCGGCQRVFYCCREHQVEDWKRSHKAECKSEDRLSMKDRKTDSQAYFPSFTVVTEPEPSEEERNANRDLSYEEKLAKKYMEEQGGGDAEDGKFAKEEFNADDENHDKAFRKFQDRISCEPEQVIRYCRGSDPLWVAETGKLDEAPACKHCGGETWFEFQILSTALYYLKCDELEKESIDWGTLAVYACAKSCNLTVGEEEGPKSAYVEEYVHRQMFSAGDTLRKIVEEAHANVEEEEDDEEDEDPQGAEN